MKAEIHDKYHQIMEEVIQVSLSLLTVKDINVAQRKWIAEELRRLATLIEPNTTVS